MQLELKGNNIISLSSSKYYLCKGSPVVVTDFMSMIIPQVMKDIKCYIHCPEYPEEDGLYVDLEHVLADPENYFIVAFNIDYDKIINIDVNSTPHKCITISDAIKSNPESYENFKIFIDNFTEVSREQYIDTLNTEKWKYK